VLELRIGQAVKEFAKPIYLVALGDDDENRKSHIQHALNHIELLRDFAGLLLNRVRRILDQANRANVSIYMIDSSGLIGGTPQSGALVPSSALSAISAATSQEGRIRAGAGESVFDISRNEGVNRQQDLLYRISGDTGGQFIKNTNDIAAGLGRIDSEIRARYTLAYRSSDPNFDGSFRKIKVEVRRPEANVVARHGYYAIPPSQIIPLSPEDRKLLAGFAETEAHSTLPVSWELNSFRSQQGSYIVPVSFEIPPQSVSFDRMGDKQRLQLDVLGVVKGDSGDKILSRLGGAFDVGLSTRQFESISNDKIFYRQDIELEPGNYTIDLVVKDRQSGKAAAKRVSLMLPVAGSEFSVTEPVLSRHAERFGRGDGWEHQKARAFVQATYSAVRCGPQEPNALLQPQLLHQRPKLRVQGPGTDDRET